MRAVFSILTHVYSLIFLYLPVYNMPFAALMYSKYRAVRVSAYPSLTRRVGI